MEGKFRYTRCPQGACFAGDAYNRRHAAVTAEVPRKETIVDDTLMYDDLSELEQHWWRTIDYLILCGENGIILNPDKLQFARIEADFAGFRISDSSVEPLPKYLDAIRDFPTPKSITDIRSWFGLVNQLSNYAQLRDMMQPFRKFLSPKVPFTWNDELQSCFEASKNAIIEASNMLFASPTPRESPVSEPTGPIVGLIITYVKSTANVTQSYLTVVMMDGKSH